MKRMAVIFNSDYQNWPMGGMITYVVQAVSMLSDTFEIELWGCAVDGKKPQPVAVGNAVYPIHVNTKAKTHKKVIPNVVRCFWGNLAGSQQFCAENYDILCFHLSASELGWFLGEKLKHPFGRRKKKPLVILHQHGMAYGNPVGDRLDYYAMEQADLVFFTTDRESLQRHRAHIRNTPVVWMPSMVDTEFFCPVSAQQKEILRKELNIGQDKTVFIYTGRITGWKNPLLLLDAFACYQNRNDGRGYLIYVGEGDCAAQLEMQIQRKGLTASVRLAGRQDRQQIRALLQASDVFVLPSRGEGVSVSTLEAMAVGLPVAAFAVEGMTGLVDGQSGVLAETQDSRTFASAMEQASSGVFCPQTTVQQYSVERVRKIMLDAIRNAMELKEKKNDNSV